LSVKKRIYLVCEEESLPFAFKREPTLSVKSRGCEYLVREMKTFSLKDRVILFPEKESPNYP
jgi:hypothetical protein